MRPRCSRPIHAEALDAGRDRQVDPVPEVIAYRHPVAGSGVERGRQLPLHPEQGLEDLPDRLAEAFRRVLHARGLPWEAAIPCGGAATVRDRARTSRYASTEPAATPSRKRTGP